MRSSKLGKSPPGLDADGLGMLRYPSGSVCVNVTVLQGNKEYYFYDSSRDGTTKLLGRFSQGVGFIQWPSGVQRCSITNTGGQMCDEKGCPQQEWPWQVHGKRTGPKRPVDFKMNNNISFRCVDQQTIVAELRLTGQSCIFDLGKKNSDEVETFSDIMVAMKKKGHIGAGMSEMLSHMPTLLERYDLDAKDQGMVAVQLAQKKNWALPQISASGREVQAFSQNLTLPGLSEAVGTVDNITTTIKDFHTAVGLNVTSAASSQREACAQHQSTRKPKGSPFVCKAPEVTKCHHTVCSATVKKRAKAIAPLQPMSVKKIDRELAAAPAGQVVVVLCSTRHDENCKGAEKMMTRLNHRFMREARQKAARTPPPPPKPVEPEEEDGADAGEGGEGGEAKEKPQEAEQYVVPECAIMLNDCARSQVMMKRYDFTICPMYLMYFNGQLIYASNTFNGFEKTEQAFLKQIDNCKKMGGRQQFLPADFSMNMSVKELSSIK